MSELSCCFGSFNFTLLARMNKIVAKRTAEFCARGGHLYGIGIGILYESIVSACVSMPPLPCCRLPTATNRPKPRPREEAKEKQKASKKEESTRKRQRYREVSKRPLFFV